MDTSGYLTRHGWLGTGHSLQPTGNGIKNPILVSKKSNGSGLGRKQSHNQADQWWVHMVDHTLKGLQVGVDGAAVVSLVDRGVPSSTGICFERAQGAGTGAGTGTGNLYESFVKGEGLAGTMEPQATKSVKSKPIVDGEPDTQYGESLDCDLLDRPRVVAGKMKIKKGKLKCQKSLGLNDACIQDPGTVDVQRVKRRKRRKRRKGCK